MSYQEVLSQRSIAISASDSPDMPALGLSEEHLRDAMAEIARHLLALGARLCYGGDLRSGGFSEVLFELIQRHRRDAVDRDAQTGVTNFLAWPLHLQMPFEELETLRVGLGGIAELLCLDEAGAPLTLQNRQAIQARPPSDAEWAIGLTSMRQSIQSATQARIVLGGQVDSYRGSMPGIAEEALISLQAGTPLYLVGGFGGCARDIAETLTLVEPWAPLNRKWHGRSLFEKFTPELLKNGLTERENQVLARTPHVDQAIILILKGLVSIK
jgi:hypothetical protein